jgi:nitroimidazol reductase NimA-like FMN-containing flavoprotein (pyridoxamine 5'-phosphate oxidase superfamily)
MTDRTTVRRLPEKASHDLDQLYALLDEATVAHIGLVDDGQSYVIPMACARHHDTLLIHGSTGSRLMRLMTEGASICATVTALDGLVVARSAFNSSMNYRSAMIFGIAEPVPDQLEGLRVLTEHLLPGRWDILREPTRKELAATSVLALPLREWSLKISDGPPEDEPEDLEQRVWAGVVPLTLTAGEPIAAPDMRFDLPAPDGY